MASTFTTGTINQPDAGSVGLAMVEKIRDDVVAHAAWDLADEFTAASGTCRWYVFKCLAAQSGLSADFYVVISRILGSGELRVFVCESYNSGTKAALYWAPGSASGSIAYDSSGRNTQSYTLGTTAPVGSSTIPMPLTWVPSGTSTKWWLIVSEDGFSVAFNGASNGFFHVGAYIPLAALTVSLPIQAIGWSDTYGYITRNPAAADQTTKIAALHIYGGGYSTIGGAVPLGFSGDLRYNDKLQTNQRSVAEMGIVVYNYTAGDQASYGWALGKQKGMRFSSITNAPAGFAFGDAYVLSGRLWVPYLPTDTRMWDTGVAA